jgi:prepilin-type N-terminal cleavage/methylation domain-containing protein
MNPQVIDNNRHKAQARGFTLIEVLMVLVLFTVITAIVYATFSTVVNSTEMARADVERMRLQEYLVRSFSTNLTAVFTDVLHEDANFDFIGINFEDKDGPADSLSFCSTAPLIGGFSLPGDVKLVTYEVPIRDDRFSLSQARPSAAEIEQWEEEYGDVPGLLDSGRKLVITETPLITGNTKSLHPASDDVVGLASQSLGNLTERAATRGAFGVGTGESDYRNSADARQRQLEAERRREERSRPRPSDHMDKKDTDEAPVTSKAMFQTPYMEVGIRTLDFEYFDGKEWVKEWNSSAYDTEPIPQAGFGASATARANQRPEAMGRLPWAVRVRINFHKTDEELALEKREGLIEKEDVDFELVIPLRQGQGITQHVQDVPALQDLAPGYSAAAAAAGQTPPAGGATPPTGGTPSTGGSSGFGTGGATGGFGTRGGR